MPEAWQKCLDIKHLDHCTDPGCAKCDQLLEDYAGCSECGKTTHVNDLTLVGSESLCCFCRPVQVEGRGDE
jgi:hypothetical protein